MCRREPTGLCPQVEDRPEGDARDELLVRYIVKAELLPELRLSDLIQETDQLKKILGKSIATANANSDTPN